jgi:hypothetical protein
MKMGRKICGPFICLAMRLSRSVEPPDRLQRPAGFVDLFSTARVNSDAAQTLADLGSAGCDGLRLDRRRRDTSQIAVCIQFDLTIDPNGHQQGFGVSGSERA